MTRCVFSPRMQKRLKQESDAVWNRQRRSELKRDVLLEASRKPAEFNDAMVSLAAAVSDKSDDRQLESISTPDDR